MASFYAHYRFGKLLLPELPADVRQCVQRFRRVYDMGLQGPDIFFYYNPMIKNAVSQVGYSCHRMSGQPFFTHACKAADSEAALVYLYGLLAHYTLDSTVHPFINRMAESGQAGHVPLEMEFDRYLMEMDGIVNPAAHSMKQLIRLTRGECMTVAAFYPPATGSNVSFAVKSMALSHGFLTGGDQEKRKKLLQRVKPSLAEQFVPTQPIPEYARMVSELLARFNRSLRLYPVLLEQLQNHMKKGEALGDEFAPSFNSGRE